MRASVDPGKDEELACAIPVSPVRFDFADLRKPLGGPGDRLRSLAVAALCLAAHAAPLLFTPAPPEVARVEEVIPVEVIVEPPPEEQAKPEPQAEAEPEQPAQTIDEKPATDFARAADQDQEDGKAAQAAAETKEPEPAPQEVKTEEPSPPPTEAAPEPAPEPVPEPRPDPPPPEKPTPAQAKPRFAGLAPLPDFQFETKPAKRTDGPKGGAEPGYLSTLYGLIMRKMPRMPEQGRPAHGRVTFGIMSNGRIFQETIAIASGAPFLDAAALGAVRRAAPYPPPPKGAPVFIRFDYGSN